jgi:hypothetical protein
MQPSLVLFIKQRFRQDGGNLVLLRVDFLWLVNDGESPIIDKDDLILAEITSDGNLAVSYEGHTFISGCDLYCK